MKAHTHHSDATKLRISQKLRNRSKTPTHKERISQSLKDFWQMKRKMMH